MTTTPIKKGDRILYRPEYTAAGEAQVAFFAAEDEDGGRVLVEARLPGWAIYPTEVVAVTMIASHETPK